MAIQNHEIASFFSDIANLLEIQGANPFRVRAYRNAARTIGDWPRSLASVLQEGEELPAIPGVGKDLQEKVRELVATRKLPLLDKLRKETPESLLALLRIPTLGPRRVRLLQEELKIRSADDLKQAVAKGKLEKLPGFGPRLIEKIRTELSSGATAPQRARLADAEAMVAPLLEYLRGIPGTRHITVAGSYRRRAETVGDLDILVTCAKGEFVTDRFAHYEDVREIVSQGPTRSTVILHSGMQVDLRVVEEASYGSALHYFTGSKAHNIEIRRLAQARGLKINEYGVFKGAKRVGGRTEEEIFRAVGLPYIEPELRENRGEIDAAREGRLPRLVEVGDLKGDIHSHTDATDGRATLEEMAAAAKARGYKYLAVTDHTQRLTVARGQDRKRLRQQLREIDRINGRLRGFQLLKSAEVDILEDGSLDLPDDVLAELDLTVCSVHSFFELSAEKQTERIIRAMDHPNFHVLGHPSGRLIGKRRPYPLDWERILRAARDRGCILEINAQPERMDLPDTFCQQAKSLGLRFAISTDSHSVGDLELMRFGVGIARRGWVEPGDVINTRPWSQARKLLRRTG